MSDSAEAVESRKRRRQILNLMQAGKHLQYDQVAERLRKARELFHDEIAYLVEAPINQQLAQMPQETLKQKQELARWLNGELRFLGVAVKDQQSNHPAFLRGSPSKQEGGRFQVCWAEGHNIRTLFTSNALMPLKFVGNADRGGRMRERRKWQDRITHASDGPSVGE